MWSWDFSEGSGNLDRPLRRLTLVDELTRDRLMLEVERSMTGERSTSRADILVRATQAGLSERKALTLLKGAEAVGAAFRLPRGPRDPAVYSRSPQSDIR